MHLVAPDFHRDAEHESSPHPKERRIEMGGQRAHLALALVGLAAIASAVPLCAGAAGQQEDGDLVFIVPAGVTFGPAIR